MAKFQTFNYYLQRKIKIEQLLATTGIIYATYKKTPLDVTYIAVIYLHTKIIKNW